MAMVRVLAMILILADPASGTQGILNPSVRSQGDFWDKDRDDFKVMQASISQSMAGGLDAVIPNTQGYPLVTHMLYEKEHSRWSISDLQVPSAPRHANRDGCLAGRVVVGVMSMAVDVHGRNRHRHTMKRVLPHPSQSVAPLCLQLMYVVGTIGIPEAVQNELKEEMNSKKDLVMLDIVENMNRGKTHKWFDFALQNFPHADFMAKMDLDAFLAPVQLLRQLARLPAKNLYYGFDGRHNTIRKYLSDSVDSHYSTSPLDAETAFHCGMFYLLSRDALECALRNQWAPQHANGPEDQVVANWLFHAECTINFAADMFRMYDYETQGGHSWERLGENNETVVIHQLKTDADWLAVDKWVSSTFIPTAPDRAIALMRWELPGR